MKIKKNHKEARCCVGAGGRGGSGRWRWTVQISKASRKCISNRRRAAATGGPRQHVIRPAGRCGRRAAVRLLGARDGGRGAAAALSAESREKRSDEEERKRQNGIPELPDDRLACKTTDSCFPLIYLQQEDAAKKRGRERVGVLSRTQRGAPPPLHSSACLLLRAPGPPLAPPPDCVGVCGRGLCALTLQSRN